jgi:3-hydroxyanthranilate 3,4-dioxygenase
MSVFKHSKPFNLIKWVDQHRADLKPPVSNKMIFEDAGMIVQIIGGGNTRMDFHDDPVEEFFFQLKGDMLIKVWQDDDFIDVIIREGEVYLLPPHVRHSPQRPDPNSIGLVVEGTRTDDHVDGFEWFCFNCKKRVHRVDVKINNIVEDLPPLYDQFAQNIEARTCDHCGAIHPGKGMPPEEWVKL